MSRIAVATNVSSSKLVEQRQNAIIQAAIKVIKEKGYHNATVRDIGREAGLTQGTLYNYIRSKEDILYLVCKQAVTAYIDAINEAVEGVDDPMERILRIIHGTLDAMWEHQENILLVYQETHSLDRRYRKEIRDLGHVLTQTYLDLLTGHRKKHGLPDMDMTLLANILSFLPGIIALRRWELRGKASRAEIVAGIEKFLVQGLAGSLGEGKDPAGR